MQIEILEIATQSDLNGRVAQLAVTVSYGQRQAQITLWPQPPLDQQAPLEHHARLEIAALVEGLLRKKP